jgi:DNA-binding LacI/PurR family transcriptional regulator
MAVGALREVRSRGLRAPEDVSVTGFDNVTIAQFAVPALTTVHIPREQIGRTVCDCLLKGDVAPEQEFVIEPELVVRDSTGPAPR